MWQGTASEISNELSGGRVAVFEEDTCNLTGVSVHRFCVNRSSDLNEQLCALSDLETTEIGILEAFAGEHQNAHLY